MLTIRLKLVLLISSRRKKNVLEWLEKKLTGCDKLITWHGNGFDIPFIMSRAIVQKVYFAGLAELPMLDLYEWCRENLILSSYSLGSVSRFLGVKMGKSFKEFRGGDILTLFKLIERGDYEARKLIVDHCKDDIIALKLVHDRTKSMVERSEGSLRRVLKEE